MTSAEIDGLSASQVQDYLARIGIDRPADPSGAALRELQLHHLLAVPFENLSIHLDEPISLTPDDLYAKIVERRRGGFCYELNGLFALLLRALGYRVELLSCSVFMPRGLGPPFDHLALVVGVPGADPRWLADVGFGRHSAHPLRLDTTGDQDDPTGMFRLVTSDVGDIDVHLDGKPQYRAELRTRSLSDFEPTCWWQQTAPTSHFRRGPVCSMLTETFGMITLADHTFVSTEGGERAETELESDDEVLAAYREHFGVRLERVPVPVQRD